jgi:hypothetical protein
MLSLVQTPRLVVRKRISSHGLNSRRR